MTARDCFLQKVTFGLVTPRVAVRVNTRMDEFQAQHATTMADAAAAQQAAIDAARAANREAEYEAAVTYGSLISQANILARVTDYGEAQNSLRATTGFLGFGTRAPPTLRKETDSPLFAATVSLLTNDIWGIASWKNVEYVATGIRKEAQRRFADAIELLRPKVLGLKEEVALQHDLLHAVYGRADVNPDAVAAAGAWHGLADWLRVQFNKAAGFEAIPKRPGWLLPNPPLESAKVTAFGRDGAKQYWRERVDRDKMLDFETGLRLTDERFERLLDEAYSGWERNWAEGPPSPDVPGRRMMANSRSFARFFVWKDADAWLQVAQAMGSHASPYLAMMEHFRHMADDTAMMQVFGPNPEAAKRFIHAMYDREASRLSASAPAGATDEQIRQVARQNRAVENQVRSAVKSFDDVWSQVTGLNAIPVNSTVAARMADVRTWLTGSQLGSAVIPSLFGDPVTIMMTARFNGLPVMPIITRAVQMMATKGSEIHAAQLGLGADSIGATLGHYDRLMGDEIRTGKIAKMGSAIIRASGLRKLSQAMRASFAQGIQAQASRERVKAWADVDPTFKASLQRYGIGEDDWRVIQAAEDFEPRPGAPLLRANDIAAVGGDAAEAAAEKFARFYNTEMDYAVIEGGARARAFLVGDTRPGSLEGEAWRAVGMYKSWPVNFVMLHMARAFSRGWDGSRLGYGALMFTTMTMMGVLSMQSKEIVAGRDPLNMDPTTNKGLLAWGKAIMQGGGLGVFGDMLFVDKTKYGNSWMATMLGPVPAAIEDVGFNWAMRNIQRASKGEETHFAGDALYIAGRYTPGSTLWYGKLAFQRGVLDQTARIIDPRAGERFLRIEKRARKEWDQEYWLPPGRTEPRRGPDLERMFGR